MSLRLLPWLAWLAYLAGCLLILENTVRDFRPGGDGVFIEQRGAIGENPIWLTTLYLHILAGLICLFSALPQFSRKIIRSWPSLHRVAGRAYVVSVLLVLCPTGFYLGLYAKGGFLGKLGFLTLAVASFHTTVVALRAVLGERRNLAAHQVWMIRSFALAASAVSFRIFHAIGYLMMIDDTVNYVCGIWLSILVNLAVAELIIHRGTSLQASLKLQPSQSPTSI